MKPPFLPVGLLFAAALSAQEPAPAQVEGVKGVEQRGAPRVKPVDPSQAKSAQSVPQAAQPVDQPVKAAPQKGQAVEQQAKPMTQDAKAAGQEAKAAGQDAKAAGQDAKAAGQDANAVPPPPPQGAQVAGQEAKAAGQDAKAAGQDAKAAGQEATAAGQAGKGIPQEAKAAGQGGQPVEQHAAAASAVKEGAQAVPPPPPKGVGQVEGIKAGAAGAVRPVTGVAGLDADKIRNLEAALQAKPQEGPVDKKKLRAAAQLLGDPKPSPEPKPVEKTDARSMLNEFKLPEGS